MLVIASYFLFNISFMLNICHKDRAVYIAKARGQNWLSVI